MLKNIYIENIAIIEKASLDFDGGFIVLSGETGAGKSIIIDAINAIMGGRTSRELIRNGSKKALVSALFGDLSLKAGEEISALGVEISDGQLALQREIFMDGRNVCKIGTKSVTTAVLKEVCKHLITIHGQHDGTALLDEESHLEYLDEFGNIKGALDEYITHFESLLSQNRRIKSLSMSMKEQRERIEQLNVIIDKISELDPEKGEYNSLKDMRNEMMGAQAIKDSLLFALSSIDDDDGNGALPLLSIAKERLEKAERYSADIGEIVENTTEILENIQDLARKSASLLDNLGEYPMSFEQVEERLGEYEALSKKYSLSPDGLCDYLEERRQELLELTDTDGANIEKLKEQYSEKRSETLKAAQALTNLREQAAVRLKASVENELTYLDMKNAKLQVEFLPQSTAGQVKFGKKGIDTVRFMLSANAGEGYKALSKVASGGELSRIMLAIKSVLARGEHLGTMIFDEIDTGVSGRAANKVGEKMWQLSKDKQVICVTHLPQIASFADEHHLVEKTTHENTTNTNVYTLDSDGQAKEIARLTGGREITHTTVEAAREMLDAAREFKKLQ